MAAKLAEHHRCLAATRKRDHGELVNDLLQIGGTIDGEKQLPIFSTLLPDGRQTGGKVSCGEHPKRQKAPAARKTNHANVKDEERTENGREPKGRKRKGGTVTTRQKRDAMSAAGEP